MSSEKPTPERIVVDFPKWSALLQLGETEPNRRCARRCRWRAPLRLPDAWRHGDRPAE